MLKNDGDGINYGIMIFLYLQMVLSWSNQLTDQNLPKYKKMFQQVMRNVFTAYCMMFVVIAENALMVMLEKVSVDYANKVIKVHLM